MFRKLTYPASLTAVGVLLLRRSGLWGSGKPLPLTGPDGGRLPGSISEKAYVDIGGVRQGMFIQGAT